MAWRLAGSLEVLRAEVLALHPGTTVWTIGDEDHQDEASDHNPNAAGVVCASDTLGNAGLDLHWYSRRVVASRHPALKYVIHNRQIWSTARASEGWRPYRGSNPHTGHCHVSVGVGPDGRSTGPYDNTSPWGLLEEDDVTPDELMKHRQRWSNDWPVDRWNANGDGYTVGTYLSQTYAMTRANWEDTRAGLAELRGQVAGLAVLVQQLATAPPVPITPEQLGSLLEATRTAARDGAAQALESVRIDVVDGE